MKSMKEANNYPIAMPVWVSIILLVTTITLISSACADPETNTDRNRSGDKQEKMETVETNDSIPPEVIQAVRQEIAENNEVNPEEIEVSEAVSQAWPDGCLGLAKEDELCTQAIVEGWRVTVTNGDRAWVYRTDDAGLSLRLESESN